jgi:molybdopterin biosynthesis enzyme
VVEQSRLAGPEASPLTPLAEALARLLAGVAPAAPRRVPLRAAEGRILAMPLQAHTAVPRTAVALRDGWAVAAEDVVGASSYSPVFLTQAPAWVATGDELPPGADCVLPPDAVAAPAGAGAADPVEVTASAAPGEGVRRAGEDAGADAVLRRSGERLRALDFGVGTAIGIEMCVVREPRVRVLLVGGRPTPSSDFLQRFAVQAGARVEHQAFRERTRLSVIMSTPPADLLIMTGDMALAAEVLSAEGEVLAWSVALRPGEGTMCGRFGATPAILVPPRLETALAVALALLRPCLAHLSGAAPEPPLRAPLARKIASNLGLAEVALLRQAADGFEPLACGDLTLSAMTAADAWLAVPPDSEGFAAGELAEAFPL